jgi:ABC-type nitrate/sulfonate/bicarbonate transport system permease component
MKAIEAEPEVRRLETTGAARLSIPGQPSAWRRYEPYLIGTGAVALALAAWQAVASAQLVQPLFLPGPYDIANAEVSIFRSPDIWLDLGTSGAELGAGFGLAILAGLPTGLLMGWYRRLNHALDPFISFLYATPRVALLPLLIIWFGIGVYSKIAVIFLGAFFPIAINTMAGIRSLDSSLLRAARSFGASDARLFTTVALPGSVPFILTGLRLGVGHALVGVVVGELVAAQHGIGYEMMVAGSTWQTPKVFAYLILLAGTGVVLTVLLQRIERRFDAWRPRN